MRREQRSGRGVDGRPGRRLEPLLPVQRRGGHWSHHRTVLDGMFRALDSGARWRDVPEHHGRCQTLYGRYRRRVGEGVIDQMPRALHVRLDKEGRIDWSVFDVDGTSIRAHRAAAAGASGESKKDAPTSLPDRALERFRGGVPWNDPAEALTRSFIL